MKRMIVLSVVFAGLLVVGAVPNAQARDCSTATLQGGYGFFAYNSILPAGTPRLAIGRLSFDGKGNFTNAFTFNDNGTVSQHTDFGTYTVNADCTGKIFTNGGTKTIEIVIVDSGNEFYQLRTEDASVLFLFNAAKKQFPGDNSGGN
jgi:hypothetical protein